MRGKRFRTIVADPPWEQGTTGVSHGAGFSTRDKLSVVELPYSTMPLDEIAALPVAEMAEEDSQLFLWTTQAFLRASFSIVEAWGFGQVSATLVWCKEPRGFPLGGTFGATTEFCQFARKGKAPVIDRVDRRWFTWPRQLGPPAPRGQKRPYNGTKPDAFYDMVESVGDAPRLELFARRARFGWDYWGDESLQTVEMPAA